MTIRRHANLDDIAQAIEARLTAYCPLLQDTLVLQSPDPNLLASTIANRIVLPAAVVVLGTWDTPGDNRVPALPLRILEAGILIVGDEDMRIENRATTFWAIVDQVQRAFLPATLRSEDERYPIAILGDQTGDDRGTIVRPTGWTPIDTRKQSNRAAGILTLTLYDDVRDRADVPSLPEGSPIPVNDASIQIQYSADDETWSSTYTSGDPYARFSVDGGSVWSETLLFRGPAGSGTNAIQLQGTDISEDAPADNQVLAYDAELDAYVPTDQSAGTTSLDGGAAATTYGGTTAIDGGAAA